MSFRLVSQSVTLDDLERRNSPNFASAPDLAEGSYSAPPYSPGWIWGPIVLDSRRRTIETYHITAASSLHT